MNPQKNIVRTLLYLCLIGGSFFFLFRQTDLNAVLAVLSRANKYWLIPALALMVFMVSCEGFALRYFLRLTGQKRPLRCFLRYAFAGHYFTSITPGAAGGQPAQLFFMTKDGLSCGSASVALLLFNMTYHTALLIISAVLFLFKWQRITQIAPVFRFFIAGGAAVHAALILFFLLLMFSPNAVSSGCRAILRLLSKTRWARRSEGLGEKFSAQLALYRESAELLRKNPQIFWRTLPIPMLQVLLILSVPFFAAQALGLQGCAFPDLLALQAASMLAADSLPLPGGVGISETALLSFYGGIFGSSALPAVLLCRLCGYYLPVFISGVLLCALAPKKALRFHSASDVL